MDAVSNTFDRLRGLDRAHRIAAVVLTACGVVSVLLFSVGERGRVDLGVATHATAEEQQQITKHLRNLGLTDFQWEDGRLSVPEGASRKYETAVEAWLGPKANSSVEEQVVQPGLFTTHEQLQLMKDAALRSSVRNLICSVPDVKDASVTWARSKTRQFGRKTPDVTATIRVEVREGARLTDELVHSLRAAVARMIPDLPPHEVTVFDQTTGLSHTTTEVAFGRLDRLMTWQRKHERKIRARLTQLLSDVPGGRIELHLDLDQAMRLLESREKNNEAQLTELRFLDIVPGILETRITVPRAYAENEAIRRNLLTDNASPGAPGYKDALAVVTDDLKQRINDRLVGSSENRISRMEIRFLDQLNPDAVSRRKTSQPVDVAPDTLPIRWTIASVMAVVGLLSLVLVLNRRLAARRSESERSLKGPDSRNAMVSFEQLIGCTDKDLHNRLRQSISCDRIGVATWVVALKGVTPSTTNRFLRAFDEPNLSVLVDSLSESGSIRLADIEAAQQDITAFVRQSSAA